MGETTVPSERNWRFLPGFSWNPGRFPGTGRCASALWGSSQQLLSQRSARWPLWCSPQSAGWIRSSASSSSISLPPAPHASVPSLASITVSLVPAGTSTCPAPLGSSEPARHTGPGCLPWSCWGPEVWGHPTPQSAQSWQSDFVDPLLPKRERDKCWGGSQGQSSRKPLYLWLPLPGVLQDQWGNRSEESFDFALWVTPVLGFYSIWVKGPLLTTHACCSQVVVSLFSFHPVPPSTELLLAPSSLTILYHISSLLLAVSSLGLISSSHPWLFDLTMSNSGEPPSMTTVWLRSA